MATSCLVSFLNQKCHQMFHVPFAFDHVRLFYTSAVLACSFFRDHGNDYQSYNRHEYSNHYRLLCRHSPSRDHSLIYLLPKLTSWLVTWMFSFPNVSDAEPLVQLWVMTVPMQSAAIDSSLIFSNAFTWLLISIVFSDETFASFVEFVLHLVKTFSLLSSNRVSVQGWYSTLEFFYRKPELIPEITFLKLKTFSPVLNHF